MKKNFFKKLSFVMALAMIVSIIAPAAGAFAAESAHLNATKKYLHLSATTGYNEYDFNIAHKQSGWKYAWTSSDEDVATVDAATGLTTATGVGSAKVSVAITDKDGADVTTLDATVVVRDNIKDITEVYMQTEKAPALDKLEVGSDYDFGRKFVTVAGSTTETSSITRWFVDSDKATITDAGVFKATEAGTYNVTAVAFQSKDKYNAWVALKDTTSKLNVLASKTIEVKVVGKMDSVKQADLSSAKVTFTTPVKDASSKLAVSLLVGTTKVKQLVKEVKMDDKNLVATVSLWVPFQEGQTYVIDYPDMTAVQFVAAKSAQDQVASMAYSTTTVTVGTPKDLNADVKLFNADGVDITSATLKGYITYSSSSNKAYLNGANVSMFTVGDAATVTATYHTYKYDTTTGQEIGKLTKDINLVAVATPTVAVSTIAAWTIGAADTASPDYTNVKHSIAVGESGRLYVNANQTNSETKVSSAPSNYGTTLFSLTSSDQSILIVDAGGNLYPVKAGSVVVVIKYNGTIIGAESVTVNAAKAPASIKVLDGSSECYGFALANGAVDNSKTLTVKVYDQYTNELGTANATVERLSKAPDEDITSVGSGLGNSLVFNAAGHAAGSYTYKITVGDYSRVVNIVVSAPNSAATSYKLKLSGTSFDLAAKAGETNKSLTVQLVGYANNGVAVTTAALTASAATPTAADVYRVAIDCPDGTTYDVAAYTAPYVLSAAVSGGAMTKLPSGTYTVTAYKSVLVSGSTYTNIVIDTQVFTVSNTQAAPVLASVKSLAFTDTVASTTATDASLRNVAYDCFKITLGGNEVAESDIISVNVVGTTESMYVTSVVVRQHIDTTWIDYTVNVGLNINKN